LALSGRCECQLPATVSDSSAGDGGAVDHPKMKSDGYSCVTLDAYDQNLHMCRKGSPNARDSRRSLECWTVRRRPLGDLDPIVRAERINVYGEATRQRHGRSPLSVLPKGDQTRSLKLP
jgi:hypothetical protein